MAIAHIGGINSLPSSKYKALSEFFIFDGAHVSLSYVHGSCCTKLIREQPRNLRFHRVQRYDGTTTQIVNNTSNMSIMLKLRQNRLAYGDIVYVKCRKSRKVMCRSLYSLKASWKKCSFYHKNSRQDTKCHFRIVGKFRDGSLLTEDRKFELQSVHWKDCYLAVNTDNGEAVIDNCAQLKTRKLTLFAEPVTPAHLLHSASTISENTECSDLY